MNNSTVWSLPTAAQRASGPRHARAERGLRAECVTWKSLGNHRETLCFQWAPQVHRFHTKMDCAPKDSTCACQAVCTIIKDFMRNLIKKRVIYHQGFANSQD